VSLLELTDIGVRAGDGAELLHHVNLVIEEGSYTAIVGESGSGKSTLLNVAGLLTAPTSGEVRIDRVLTAALSDSERALLRASSIGFLFQAFHLIPYLTVLENVMLGSLYAGFSRAERLDKSRAALASIGIDTLADKSPLTLSGGERQRVALARAISGTPRILLCDEPTGNLDRQTSLGVMELFDRLRSDGLTIVLVTHSEELSERADTIFRVQDGVVARG